MGTHLRMARFCGAVLVLATAVMAAAPHDPAVTVPIPDPATKPQSVGHRKSPLDPNREWRLPVENVLPENASATSNSMASRSSEETILSKVVQSGQDFFNDTFDERSRRQNLKSRVPVLIPDNQTDPVPQQVLDNSGKPFSGAYNERQRLSKRPCKKKSKCPGPDCGVGDITQAQMSARNAVEGVDDTDIDDCGEPLLPKSCNPARDSMLHSDIVESNGLTSLYAHMIIEVDCVVCRDLEQLLDEGYDGSECSGYKSAMQVDNAARDRALGNANYTTDAKLEKKAVMSRLAYRSCSGLAPVFRSKHQQMIETREQTSVPLCKRMNCCHN